MDTIIYFIRKKGLKEPAAEPVGMRSHMLIRVAMDVGQEEWFGVKLGMLETARCTQEVPNPEKIGYQGKTGNPEKTGCQEKTEYPEKTGNPEKAEYQKKVGRRLWVIRHPLQAFEQMRRYKKEQRQEKERKSAAEQEEKRLMAERAENLHNTEAAMRKLAATILDLAGDMRDCYSVYEDSVKKYLVGQGRNPDEDVLGRQEISEAQIKQSRRLETVLPAVWQQYFQIEEFNGYVHQFWVEQLLPKATWNHFVILGTAPCLFTVIEQCAHRMKSLRWILSEVDCSEEVLDFAEDFYIEYGLAIALQPIASWTKENPAALRRLRLVCETPANILDFTGEANIGITEVAEGSVWLDMLSVEEKQRRIMSRNRGIIYFSLKEKWKQAQRPQPFLPYLLDT